MVTAARASLVDLVVSTPDALQKFKVVKDNNIHPD